MATPSKRSDVIDDSRSVVKGLKGKVLSCREGAMAAQYRLSFWRRVLNRLVRVLLQVGVAARNRRAAGLQ
jgi:hypothetical protein